MLIILVVVVLLLVAGGGAAWFFLSKRHAADDEGGEAGAARPAPAAHHVDPKTPPTFVPIDNMVVNLADPGGDRYAQIGITLELSDPKVEAQIKQFMPSIRSAILMLVSQRTSDELLTREGKQKLALDIRREVSKPLGYTVPKPRKKRASEDEDDDEDAAPARPDNNPVRGVLFSSFIIQ
ncbi:flagellar basal body-associated FliL family protein [Paracidovorax wautersii]|uniref:flagellar basal body-associated FliL family protein n=1 Tax=Paracidovorax wautersii TaxID=1177982 RepID=UPI0031CE2406